MHGLVFRAVERFLEDVYGNDCRIHALMSAGFDNEGPEAMHCYVDERFDRLIAAASSRLGKPVEELLEDIGLHLVSRDGGAVPRRLLRFAGTGFVEFLLSLDELPGRIRLAVPDLAMPEIRVERIDTTTFRVGVDDPHGRAQPVLMGVLRAMADDYGSLAMIRTTHDGHALLVSVHETSFAAERPFALSRSAVL